MYTLAIISCTLNTVLALVMLYWGGSLYIKSRNLIKTGKPVSLEFVLDKMRGLGYTIIKKEGAKIALCYNDSIYYESELDLIKNVERKVEFALIDCDTPAVNSTDFLLLKHATNNFTSQVYKAE